MVRLLSTMAALVFATNLCAQEPKTQPTQAADPVHPRVKMETSLGDIVLELDAEKAPITVLNFIRYAEDGFYEGTIFHRVKSKFMIQGGGFAVDMVKKEGPHPPIRNEWQNGLKNMRGTIAMARTPQPHSATSQFFINVVDNPFLDRPRRGAAAAYTVFGKVVEGMDTVEKIRDTEVSTHPKYGGGRQPVVPVVTVVVKSVKLASEFDREKTEQLAKAAEEVFKKADEVAKKAEEEAMAAKEKQFQDAAKKIEAETGKKMVKTASGLMSVVLQEGTGDTTPNPTDKVEAHYSGWLLDGTKFDSSYDRGQPFTFSMRGGVIAGWIEGVGLMKVGEKRKFLIPPDLAYGQRGSPPKIGPNEPLIFEIELLAIK